MTSTKLSIRLIDGTLANPQTLTREEWESVCDGCAKCCTIPVYTTHGHVRTNKACPWLDRETGQCSDYENRPWSLCVTMNAANLDKCILPDTCPYIGGERDTYDPENFDWSINDRVQQAGS